LRTSSTAALGAIASESSTITNAKAHARRVTRVTRVTEIILQKIRFSSAAVPGGSPPRGSLVRTKSTKMYSHSGTKLLICGVKNVSNPLPSKAPRPLKAQLLAIPQPITHLS
jgi:hypothetical protein